MATVDQQIVNLKRKIGNILSFLDGGTVTLLSSAITTNKNKLSAESSDLLNAVNNPVPDNTSVTDTLVILEKQMTYILNVFKSSTDAKFKASFIIKKTIDKSSSDIIQDINNLSSKSTLTDEVRCKILILQCSGIFRSFMTNANGGVRQLSKKLKKN
tara:strand:+ start:179 stop:649 length:471 start_codon:yes stop_codon:yes gene_type:complete